MIKSLSLLLLAFALRAQVPYQKTQGPLTVYATDWSTMVAQLTNAPGPAQPLYGLWVTACTTDKSTTPLKAAVTIRTNGTSATQLQNFSSLNQYECSSILFLSIKRSDVINLVIITSAAEFTDVGAN